MWGFHLPIHDKRKVTPQIFDLGLVLCRCPQQAYGGGWDAAALTAARGSSVDYGILCQCDGDRLSGCLAHVFDAVIVATLRRSTRMTREGPQRNARGLKRGCHGHGCHRIPLSSNKGDYNEFISQGQARLCHSPFLSHYSKTSSGWNRWLSAIRCSPS